ncbi:ABC transporter ATP-binding protein [Lachnospiraceae bacterium MD308]|nr:ABC transporter ATP-binding protein [Lachnospiraceae bacterium MD308]
MKKYLDLMSCKTKIKCTGVILLALVGSILASVWPVCLGKLYTTISNGGLNSIAQVIADVALFGLIYLSAECISIVRRVMLDCIIVSHEAEIRESSIEKFLKMPVAYYSGKLSGERTAQLNQGVTGLSQLIKICCNDVFATVLIAICTLFQVIVNAPLSMAGIMMGYLALIILISIFQIRSQNGIRENIISQKNALDGQVCQSIANLELIRSMDAGDYEKVRLKPAICKISATEKKHHRYMGFFDCVKQFFKITFQVIILFVSVVMISAGKMAPGAVITVCLLFQQLIKPIDEVYRFMDETASSIVKAKVLTEVASRSLDPVFSIVSVEKHADSNDIALKNVVITDPTGEKELASYEELHIPGNSTVAVVGGSGCGKTTLMRCLNRYFPYITGNIILFGNKLHEYSQHELTEQLMYVPQKAFFFAGTVRENLIYGLSREISDEELNNALRNVCLYDVLASKVRKIQDSNNLCTIESVLDYHIGEGGAGLSGGEGQRLSLARAFLRKPKMFIFDESTTGLDGETAQTVLNHIEEYAKSIGAGIIYISHDDNVIHRCQHIIELQNKLKEMHKAA